MGAGLDHRIAWLKKRLELGETELTALSWASHAGDLAARTIAGHDGCPLCDGRGLVSGELTGEAGEKVCQYNVPFSLWIERFAEADPETMRQALGAAYVHALRVQHAGEDIGERATNALNAWIETPTEMTRMAVEITAESSGSPVVQELKTLVNDPSVEVLRKATEWSTEQLVRSIVDDTLIDMIVGDDQNCIVEVEAGSNLLEHPGDREEVSSEELEKLQSFLSREYGQHQANYKAFERTVPADREKSPFNKACVEAEILTLADRYYSGSAVRVVSLGTIYKGWSMIPVWSGIALVVRDEEDKTITMGVKDGKCSRVTPDRFWAELKRWNKLERPEQLELALEWARNKAPDRVRLGARVFRAMIAILNES